MARESDKVVCERGVEKIKESFTVAKTDELWYNVVKQ